MYFQDKYLSREVYRDTISQLKPTYVLFKKNNNVN